VKCHEIVRRPVTSGAKSIGWCTDSGSETSTNGISDHDAQTVSRYGLTLSVPVADGFSAKLAWATWLTAHNGGTFNAIGLTLQYRWFDR
jgi:hypothetical protein